MTDRHMIDQAVAEPERLCCDALAELFLGETGRPGDARTEVAPVDHPAAGFVPAPVAVFTPAAAGEAKAAVSPAPPVSTADDAIAIEAVLVGHLPFMASAWVSQYARGLASDGQTVGLIRAAGGRLSVELFGEAAKRPPRRAETALDAVRQLRRQTDRWVIQVDDERAGELIDHGHADRLTLLCSPDEAALVAGYRMVKDLLEPRVELAAPLGPLHIAIAGRADAEAMAAAERLSRAAERFLGIETTVSIGAARIEAGSSASWYEGGRPASGELAQLARALDGVAPGAPDDESAAESDSAAGSRLESGSDPQGEAGAIPVAAWAPTMAGPEFFGEATRSQENGHPCAGAREPARRGAPVSNRGMDQQWDHRASEAPALSLQCPRAPGIEFRIEDGTVVAIADARTLGLDLALRHLVVACAWAAEHDALILQATGHSGRVSERVLLVEDAPAARHLLDADIRVRVAASGRGEIPLN